jgi:hypothetical protein
MNCTGACKAGYAVADANFSCSSSGSFQGELACVLRQEDVEYEEGEASAVRELSFSVEQGGEQLVGELLDTTSAASQAVATSFMNAMRLPERANVQVVHAELQRRLHSIHDELQRHPLMHERRLQQSIAVDIEITGVSTNDIEVLDEALDTNSAASTVGAHLEQNLAQVEGIDIGSVQAVGMQPLPEDPNDPNAAGEAEGGYPGLPANYTGFLEPEDGGCGQRQRLFAAVLASFAFLLPQGLAQ